MNLWIRTQRKDRLCLAHNFVIREANKNGYYAVAENRNKNTIEYGIYSTKERALEVLDEIQNILMSKIIINFKHKPIYKNDLENNLVFVHDSLVPYEDYEDKQLLTYVYEMPKE